MSIEDKQLPRNMVIYLTTTFSSSNPFNLFVFFLKKNYSLTYVGVTLLLVSVIFVVKQSVFINPIFTLLDCVQDCSSTSCACYTLRGTPS